jgi:hypothetical protein
MAKSQSIIKLQGTLGELTYVQSRAYGDHVRAKRGTYKPAKVNASLKKEGKMVLMANVPAKIFKDAIDPYRGGISGGTLWPRLVSLFRKQLKTDGKFDFSKVKRFEIEEPHPLARFINAQCTARLNKKTSKLALEIVYDRHPKFTSVKDIDGYMLTVIGIFPDLKKKTAQTFAQASKVFKLTGSLTSLLVKLNVPPKVKDYMVCLKLEGCINGIPANMRTATALGVIDAGRI